METQNHKGREINVSANGCDDNDGTAQSPFRTISAAARVAGPGDVITVGAGIYRERIDPTRGGLSDDCRITYQAAPGETVEIRGSELIKGWEKVEGDAWKVILPNSFFGGFNPYAETLRGDWFVDKGRPHHAGAVYLDGEWLSESATLREILQIVGGKPRWFAEVGEESTTIWARFNGWNPNNRKVEINVRQTVFYPRKTGINYITVRGFVLKHAATPWAPPTAEQIGLIGTNWSKGWIIEGNTISHSMCVGVTLGKYGDEWDNRSADSAEGYVETIQRAVKRGWNKETIGHHIVRNNTISHCEQAGIVGSLGAIFSQVIDNHIHHIHTFRHFGGAEIAGIKFHAPIDSMIAGNVISNSYRGLWMDWMTQGTRISRNLCYDNHAEDVFLEVNHGPFVMDNNILLSTTAIRNGSEGGAFIHNLIAGGIITQYEDRLTPYHVAHSTELMELERVQNGDDRYYGNIFAGKTGGLFVYDSYSVSLPAVGNVYCDGARPYVNEKAPCLIRENSPQVKVEIRGREILLHLSLGRAILGAATQLITSKILGATIKTKLPFENADGSPLKFDVDYFGCTRHTFRPAPGPFESLGTESLTISLGAII